MSLSLEMDGEGQRRTCVRRRRVVIVELVGRSSDTRARENSLGCRHGLLIPMEDRFERREVKTETVAETGTCLWLLEYARHCRDVVCRGEAAIELA